MWHNTDIHEAGAHSLFVYWNSHATWLIQFFMNKGTLCQERVSRSAIISQTMLNTTLLGKNYQDIIIRKVKLVQTHPLLNLSIASK